jgi:hypothetical protein
MRKYFLFFLLLIIENLSYSAVPQSFSIGTSYYFSTEKNRFNNFYSEKNGVCLELSLHYPFLTTSFEIEHHYYSKEKGEYNYDGIYYRAKLSKQFEIIDKLSISPTLGVGDHRMQLKNYKGNEAKSSESEFFFDYGATINYHILKSYTLNLSFVKRRVFTRININRSYFGLGISYNFNLSKEIKKWL